MASQKPPELSSQARGWPLPGRGSGPRRLITLASNRGASAAAFGSLLLLAIAAPAALDQFNGSRPQFLQRPTAQTGLVRANELLLSDEVPYLTGEARAERSSSMLIGPVRLEGGPDGHVFAIDDGAHEVVSEFDPSGQLLHTFQGDGAPAMKSVTDLVLLPDRIWFVDLLASAIHRLDRLKGTWRTVRSADEPYRAEVLGVEGEQLTIMHIASPAMFATVEPDGRILRSFGRVLRNQDTHSLALDGFVARGGQDLLFAGKHLSVLASFRPTGELRYLKQTVAPLARGPRVRESGGRRWLEHGPMAACSAIAADEHFIYLLSRRADGLRIRAFVDLYDAAEGLYLRSLALPAGRRWRSFAVTHENLFAADSHGIWRWPHAAISETTTSPASTGQLMIELSGETEGKD